MILGSFPSVASLEARQYYAHPQNWFWRVLERCEIIETAAAPYERRVEELQQAGLGVWDLYERVRRKGSGDEQIRDQAPNRIDLLLQERGPFPILLNGRRNQEWRRHFSGLDVPTTALPSTSPRPLHWNTEESRAAAISEWCAALSAAHRGRLGR